MPARILIADDYDDNRELLSIILANDGYTILEARDGQEALAMARDARPDVVLVDLSMPSLDGFGVLRELRSHESTKAIPCVAVTAFAGDRDRHRALNAGFDAYVSKPFHAKELLDLIKQLVSGNKPEEGQNRLR